MRCRRAGLRHATHARNHPPGPASAERPQAEQATYAARPIRRPLTAYRPGPGGGQHIGDWPHASGPTSARPRGRPAQYGHVSQLGTASLEPQQHGEQLAVAEPGPRSVTASESQWITSEITELAPTSGGSAACPGPCQARGSVINWWVSHSEMGLFPTRGKDGSPIGLAPFWLPNGRK